MRRWLLPFLALASCAAPKQQGAAPQTDSYIVTAGVSPFYSYGPAQTQGAEFSLKKGAAITMVHRESGFSRIRTSDGREGYVANDTIAPLPPPAPVFATAGGRTGKRSKQGATSSRANEKLNVVPVDQMFEEPPLPSNDVPSNSAKH